SRLEIISDLTRYANKHNGQVLGVSGRRREIEMAFCSDSFTFGCWHAMDLIRNLDKAKTHFLGVVLRRKLDATTDRTLYTLVDVEVLPFRIMDEKFKSSARLTPSGQELPGLSPINVLKQDAESRKNDGALGSVMVISTELDEKAPSKSVEQYMIDTAAPTFQPLRLFKVHRDAMHQLNENGLFRLNWKLCLKNALDGGIYGPIFRPHNGE
ncbi:hypothetical protein DFH09DRAFT_899927, partial [Mycena vulgaris]